MRIVFLVEGKTERESLRAFFRKWLEANTILGLGIDIYSLKNASRLFADAPKRAQYILNAPDGKDVIAVFSLMDLYGAGIYPEDKKTVKERYVWGKQEMESHCPDPRYKHFFAVHETEAWLLSQPENLPSNVRDALRKRAKRPENVNFDHPPAARIDEQYKKHLGREYGKVRDGSKLFGRLDPIIAAQACPHLKMLLDEMINLIKSAKS